MMLAMRSRTFGIVAVVALLFTADLRAEAAPALYTVRVASGLEEPVFATAPTGDPRLFIVERAGVIRILKSGVLLPTAFLDIRALVSTRDAYGLFGLAFAPDYASSGLFYVYYMNEDDESIIGRYRVSADPDVAMPVGETVIAIAQTHTDHNGGTIAFSPVDGYLYLALGDGGSGPFDPMEKAQDPQSLLGKTIRIDVSGGLGTTYTVPANNPFVSDPTVLDEIWSFGNRNPFRWSFDRLTGDQWLGDVGQELREEINFEAAGDPGGRNYGWDVMEGSECVATDPAPAPPCNDPSLTLPIYQYAHDDTQPNCSGSVTGGYVYRGVSAPQLRGHYFFADFCLNEIGSLDTASLDATTRTAELSPSQGGHSLSNVVGFGEDGMGELFIVTPGDGSPLSGAVFRIHSTPSIPLLPPVGLLLLALLLLTPGLIVLRRVPSSFVRTSMGQ